MYDEKFAAQYPTKDKDFLTICKEFLEKIEETERENFIKAGKVLGDRIMQDEVFYCVGTGGHTYVPAMDMTHRAGAFACASPTFDVSTSPFAGGTRSIRLERVEGYFRVLMEYYKIKKGDVVLIFNNIGVNAGCIDAALACKEKGATVIAVSSRVWQKQIPMDHFTRHSSKKNLFDIADICIDDYNPMGDSVMMMDGMDVPFGPISTVTDAYIVRRIEQEAIRYMVSKGFTPPVYSSGNQVGGMERNAALENKYFYRIKVL
ncbi:MAG: sugar isomerase domain-containing protein [Patescibacteria group bacterium]